jgi:acetyl/propionyl-CoA carboxylase alpha subunit
MKKVFVFATALVFAGLVACGPSAEEKQAMAEKAHADSLANVAKADSLLQKASQSAADTATTAVNPPHGAEGHKCGPDCPGMQK